HVGSTITGRQLCAALDRDFGADAARRTKLVVRNGTLAEIRFTLKVDTDRTTALDAGHPQPTGETRWSTTPIRIIPANN
ncbi:hypothetical protein ABTN43_19710, partial [Acinetobacter baumannii]